VEGKITAIMNEQMFDFHSHEDVIVQPRNVAVSDVEISNNVLLFLDSVSINL
jgi:gentisate 1,2-dioxygenase